MKCRFISILSLVCIGLTLLLSSCEQVQYRHLQRDVNLVQMQAMGLLDHISAALGDDSLLLDLAMNREDGVEFYIYRDGQLTFWSDSWLSHSVDSTAEPHDWRFTRWGNADGLSYVTYAGNFSVHLLIPIKYNYLVKNGQLHNHFIPPFHGPEQWVLRSSCQSPEYIITGLDGNPLFYFCGYADGTNNQDGDDTLAESFSFNTLSDSYQKANSTYYEPIKRRQVWIVVLGFLIGLLLFSMVYAAYRYNGWYGMPFTMKMQFLVVGMTVVCAMVTYGLVAYYARKSFRKVQLNKVIERTEFIQVGLQNMFYWENDLNRFPQTMLNVDLRDLSYTYHCDINLYNLDGKLIGSSTPTVFESGLMSNRMSPQVFFSGNDFQALHDRIGDLQYITVFIPFINGNFTTIGYISAPYYMSKDMEDMEVQEYVIQLLPIFLILIIVAIILSTVYSHKVIRSVKALSLQMQNYQQGVGVEKIRYPYRDEIKDLVDHYNDLIDKVETSAQQLAKAEREGAWRTMARQVAHEINNALTPMKLNLQMMQRLKGTPKFDSYFDSSSVTMVEEIDMLSSIASSFSTFAKMPAVQVQAVDLVPIVKTSIDFCRNYSDCVIDYDGPLKDVWVMTDPKQIGQVLLNIIRNAVQAQSQVPNPYILIRIRQERYMLEEEVPEEGKWVEVSVADKGLGIPEEMQSKMFTPNFTTKSFGAGLGLAVSKNIVESSGGKICFRSSPQGTTFYFYLKTSL